MKPQTFECWRDIRIEGLRGLWNDFHRKETDVRVRVTVTPIEESENSMDKNLEKFLEETADSHAASPPRHRQPSEPWDGNAYVVYQEATRLWVECSVVPPHRTYWNAVEFRDWITRGADQAERITEMEATLRHKETMLGLFRKESASLKEQRADLCKKLERQGELILHLKNKTNDAELAAMIPKPKPRWRKPEEWTEKDGPGMEWMREPFGKEKTRWWYFFARPDGPWITDAESIAALGRPEEEKPAQAEKPRCPKCGSFSTSGSPLNGHIRCQECHNDYPQPPAAPPIAMSGDDPPEELRVGMAAYYKLPLFVYVRPPKLEETK